MQQLKLTGKERRFDENEILVSKTDTKGRIIYANEAFCDVTGYSEKELIGQPRGITRHPDMPNSIYQLFWEKFEKGREIFAYELNRCKNGDYFWVLAHVTPTYNDVQALIGHHSNRRCPTREAVSTISAVYKLLRERETKHTEYEKGLADGSAALQAILQQKGMSYDSFVFSL